MLRHGLLAFAGCALVFFIVGCSRRDAERPQQARPNVVVVTIDTLRADHLPSYGYKAVETPAIDRLAREGVRFSAAYTPVPMTLPSHVSIFTGLLPGRHGVHDNGGSRLGAERTMATTLRDAGYSTGAFVSAFVLDAQWGIAPGFDEYFDQFHVSVRDLGAMASIQRPGGETWARAREWLDARPAASPFFLWLHLFDPHTPYHPPAPFDQQYAGREYDGEIAYSDSIVRELLATLDAKQLTDRTLIVLLSDHGEGLGEHGEDEHGLLMYDSTLHVPWIMRIPDRRYAGAVVNRAVSLVDVLPTILEIAGMPAVTGLDGVSRLPSIAAPTGQSGDVVYSESEYPRRFGWSELRGIRNEQFKFIRAPRPELYDYRGDPSESVNLAEQQPAIAARLDQILSRMVAEQKPRAQPAQPAADAAARLSALGYFSGGTASNRTGADLPDPKDKTSIFRRLTRARERLEQARDGEGVALLQALIVDEPPLEAAHQVLRDYWVARRRFPEATRWLHKMLAARPQDPLLSFDLATVYRAAGRPEDAITVLEASLATHADDSDARLLLGEVLRDAGRPAEALESLRIAAAKGASATEVNLQIARTQIRMQRLPEAEATLRAVLTADPNVSGAHYMLAHIAESRRDPVEAEREYRREIAGSPWDYQARFNLAQLLGARGAFREQAEMLQSIPQLAPGFDEIHFHIAKALLDIGDPGRLQEAIDEAQLGLKLAPAAPTAPLGHYVLADVYRLQGKLADANRELALGRALEQRAAQPPPR
jgi:arylsulfatase A-like enzyme/tetratricopeptide (TPR) repeat protein